MRCRLSTVVLALVVATAGCGDINAGDQPFAGMVLFHDPAGHYDIYLLEPPWVPIPLPSETLFVVPPSDATVSLNEADALYTLHVASVGGAPADAAMQVVAAALPDAATTTNAQKPVKTASGATGVELAWQESATIFHREVFVAASGTPTYHLKFTAKQEIAVDAMITQMIVSFVPHP